MGSAIAKRILLSGSLSVVLAVRAAAVTVPLINDRRGEIVETKKASIVR